MIKKCLLVAAGLIWCVMAGAVAPVKFSLTFDKMPLQQLVMFYYDQCEQKGLVFASGVDSLAEVITLKTPSLPCPAVQSIVADALARAGMSIQAHGSYDLVRSVALPDERDSWHELVFRPQFRDALELADQVRLVIRKGHFSHDRVQTVTAPGMTTKVPDVGGNAAGVVAKSVDKLLFFGPESECQAVEKLFRLLDVPYGQVEIKAGIYEYQTGADKASAVTAALSILGGKYSAGLTGVTGSGGASLALALPGIEVGLQLLDTDSRFKSLARPKVLVSDNQLVSFNAGQDVQVAGSVTVASGGVPVQSFQTLNAGVTLGATPHIRGGVVDLELHEVVSSFVPSPNASPSILKRALDTRLSMVPGVVYVIGGLQSSTQTVSAQRVFGWKVGDSFSRSDTEIILLLTVERTGFDVSI